MSKAHYFVKNFTKQQILDLICYKTRYPLQLTSTQRITRMYRNFLRLSNTVYFRETDRSMYQFFQNVGKARYDFDLMLQNDRDTHALNVMLAKYQHWNLQHLDSNMNMHDSRAHSPNAGKQYVWSDEQLDNQPFGYYKDKPAHESNMGEYGYMLMTDYPMQDYNTRSSSQMNTEGMQVQSQRGSFSQ